MKIAVFSDMHAISPREPLHEVRASRGFFAEAWPTFAKLRTLIRGEAPDLVICLGDMVDWYSDANRDFAIELLNELPCPWMSVPGNHDYQLFQRTDSGIRKISAMDGCETARKGWLARGIELHNRYVDAGDCGLLLLDSALSGVPDGTKDWIEANIGRRERNLVFTHVPLDLPLIRSHILTVDSARDLNKYVQSRTPWLFNASLAGRASDIFTGHLHIPGMLEIDGTRMHMLGTAVTSPRRPSLQASARIVTLGRDVDVRTISIEA